MSYSEINHQTVHAAVAPLSKEQFFTAEIQLRQGNRLDEDFVEDMAGWSDSIGDNVTVFNPDYAILTKPLQGSIQKLARNTLVRSQHFTIPTTIKPQNVEDMIYHRPVEKEFYGSIMLTEPRAQRSSIMRLVRYFIRHDPSLLIPPIDDGTEAYLNGNMMTPQEVDVLQAKIIETQRVITVVHQMERETIQNFINSFTSGTKNL